MVSDVTRWLSCVGSVLMYSREYMEIVNLMAQLGIEMLCIHGSSDLTT